MIDTEIERLLEERAGKISLLMDNEGYFRRVYEILPAVGTLREAWEATEAERTGLGLPEKYTSYESFRACKSYHRKKIFRLDDTLEDIAQ